MNKAKKGWLIAATALTVAGIMLIGGTLAAVGFDLKKLSTVEYTDVSKEISTPFDSIEISAETASVELLSSPEKECRLVFHERENERLSASVENNTLLIRGKSSKNWFEQISVFDFDSPKVTVYLPKNQYDDISISEITGGISLTGISANNLSLKATTGNICTENVSVRDRMETKTTTGCITLKNTVAARDIALSCTTGMIRFDSADAANISAHTTTGCITGTLRSGKQFTAQTTTGTVSIPPNGEGGKCDLTTTTGIIRIELE